MKQLLLATNNPAKIADITKFLSDVPVEIVTLKSLGITDQSPEDGRTFYENAKTKANFYMEKSGLPSLADDGGIEIDYLHGEPGVDSHRWISRDRDDTDEALIAYTLTRLAGVPREKRGAQMHLILALSFPDGRFFTTEGIVRGVVAETAAKERTRGFPFRSLFYLPEIQKYYDHAELTPEEIVRFDHRRDAVEKMKPIIMSELVNLPS